MPQFEVTDESIHQGESLAEKISNEIGNTRNIAAAAELGYRLEKVCADSSYGTWLGDVILEAWSFAVLYGFSSESGTDIALIGLKNWGPIPVLPMGLSEVGLSEMRTFFDLSGRYYETIFRNPFQSETARLEVFSASCGDALKAFGSALARFLGNRFESSRSGHGLNLTPGAAISTGGAGYSSSAGGTVYHVKLDTQNDNWHAHVSPAYLMHFTGFGAPTRPVYGYLNGGFWIFGGNCASHPSLVVDTTVFDIPRVVAPCVLAF